MPGRLVRAIGIRRRGITAISLGLVAAGLPAHAQRSDALRASVGPNGALNQAGDRATADAVVLTIDRTRAFYGAARPARATITVGGREPLAVTVEAVRHADGIVVASWDLGIVAPGASRSVTWDGTAAAGRIQREGTYTFRATAGGGNASAVSSTRATADFVFLRHRFPVRGSHGYGDFAAQFGGGRGHQGQDVFAACGTPLVAARGGTVQYRGFQGRAGNYLVIDGAGTGVDYVYAHLRDPARFGDGRRVFTGQLIGFVGRTGDATACHLHFEMWTGPGWYAGGAPFDPRPWLRAWDKQS